ncbi:sorting nexin-5 [Clupea harengus]|uniref:Sorting nexin-5 n=1 Tax=Clupea harengus TaxID=7950 RepID=A0A6P8FCE0_CLUHA|nr:sorting nexin-5 [Clupea harengus]
MEESGLSISADSIRVTEVTEDGDALIFTITSQKLNSDVGVCVCRTFEDFEWLQQSLFSQEDVPGLQGVIFPPLPGKPLSSPQSQAQAKALKQLGFLALGDDWKSYCKALEIYLQQVANHSTLSKNKALESLLTNSEPPGKQRVHKGIFSRLSQAVGELRKENHKDLDDFFQNERNNNLSMTQFSKTATEKFLEVVLSEQKLAVACGHLSTSLHLCVNQEGSDAGNFSKICMKLSEVIDAVKRNFEKVADNNLSTLGLGLDMEYRGQEAKKDMLFRRTCKLVELETAVKNAEKAKPNKKAIMEEVKKVVEKDFDQISSIAKEEIGCFNKCKVTLLRSSLVDWCEKQLHTAREDHELFSRQLEACEQLCVTESTENRIE